MYNNKQAKVFDIYVIHNKVTQKNYVGLTCRGLHKRWMEHLRCFRQGKITRLYSSIRKHQVDNFEMFRLGQAPSKEEAEQAEKLWIILLNTRDKTYGYNLTNGGDGGDTFSGRIHTPATRAKMSLVNRRRPISDEMKENLSIRNSARVGTKAFRFRRDVSTKEIVELYVSGLSTRDIGKKLGMEKTAILLRLRKEGVEIRPKCGGISARPIAA